MGKKNPNAGSRKKTQVKDLAPKADKVKGGNRMMDLLSKISNAKREATDALVRATRG